jgi:hypothetical protein
MPDGIDGDEGTAATGALVATARWPGLAETLSTAVGMLGAGEAEATPLNEIATAVVASAITTKTTNLRDKVIVPLSFHSNGDKRQTAPDTAVKRPWLW